MRFNIKKIGTKQYLQLLESVYDPKTKKPKTVIIKSYGEVSKLKALYDDPITYFKNIANEEIKNNKKENSITLKLHTVPARNFYDLKKDKKLFKNLIFVGHVFWSAFYHKLELDKLFKKIASNYKLDFSLNDVMKFLIYTKINFLASKRDSLYYIDSMGEKYDFIDKDIYKMNKIIVENKNIILRWIYTKISNVYKYNFKLTYYNLTHYKLEDKIELGLLFDKNDMPVNYSVYPDDKFISKMNKTYHIKKMITISETELNSKSYILKYPVKKLSKNLKTTFEEEIKPRIDKIRKDYPDLQYVYYPIVLENRNEKFIFQYYNKSKRKQAYILDNEVNKVTRILKKYDKIIDKTSKNILANPFIDDKKPDNGYSLLVTDLVELMDKEIIKVYKEQDLIKKIFQMHKSDIFSKPVIGTKEISIESHFIVSYICLLFIKLMQHELKYKYSVDDILISTKNLFYTKIDENTFILNGFNECLVDMENKIFKEEFFYNIANLSRIRNYFAKSKKTR
ncbi:hypothetical protein [Oceanivirga salmonicida]|uniref:hypothetical protein n=1 Tax=Oceanivirga salmonicida TaxID=1769291 RepID=UPI0012E3051B|nr:hypothetical protein [Oceanivirga salmonicida]